MLNIYPVIHYFERKLALEQVAIARNAGASGVFLLTHHDKDDEVVAAAKQAKLEHPYFAVGINLLTRSAPEAVDQALGAGLDMVWSYDMGVTSAGVSPLGQRLSDLTRAHPKLAFFAAVAFKSLAPETDPAAAARNAAAAGFIPTTSGSRTGRAPEVEKIRRMSLASDGGLAVASGMTAENIGKYKPHVRHVMVATSVALDGYRISPRRLTEFIRQARATQPADPGSLRLAAESRLAACYPADRMVWFDGGVGA